MKPWKIAVPLLALIVIALAVRPFLNVNPEVETGMTAEALMAETSNSSPGRTSAAAPTKVTDDNLADTPLAEVKARAPGAPLHSAPIPSAPPAPLSTPASVTIDPQVTQAIDTFNNQRVDIDERLIAVIDLEAANQSDPRIQAFLIKGLNNPDSDTRIVMIETIRSIGDPAYVIPLRKSLPGIKDAETREMTEELIEYLELPESYIDATGDAPPVRE